MRLDGKVALVTGGAMGIGAAIAARFLEAGAAVAIFDINGEAVRKYAENLSGKGRALALEGDAANEDAVRTAVERTIAEFGSLDILVNNAGIDFSGLVAETKSDQWDRVLTVNLKGAFFFCKHAVPHLQQRGGAIVIISSVRAFVSYSGGAAYDSSKAALIAFTRTLALDHGKDGIRVNAICPGPTMTEATKQLVPEHFLEMIVNFQMAIHRALEPDDLTGTAVWLASDDARMVTGQVIPVDGGMVMLG